MGDTLRQQLDTLFYEADFKFKGTPNVVVIGAGVAGVSTALSLFKCGAKVTILSAQESADNTPANIQKGIYPITSQVAGALWEYPPAVCGAHNDIDSEENAKQWTITSLRAFTKVAADPATFPNVGVRIQPSGFYYKNKILVEPEKGKVYPTMSKMLNIAKNPYISGFIYNGKDNTLLKRYKDISPPFIIDKELTDGFQHDAALIDTDLWMGFLRGLLKQCDIQVHHYVVNNFYKEKDAITKFVADKGRGTADAFVIATGVNSNYVVNDDKVYARRGAVFRFPHKHGSPHGEPLPEVAKIPHIDLLKDHSFCVPVSELNNHVPTDWPENKPGEPSHFAFVIPRGDHAIIVGGFSEAIDENHAKQSFEHYRAANKMDDEYTRRKLDNEYFQERVKEMKDKAVHFLQPVADLIKVHEPHDLQKYLYVGWRPFRIGGCRLELEQGTNIVHNYGHGGSGVSWSLGCAVEATHLVRKFITSQYKAKPIDAEIRHLLQNTTREYTYRQINDAQSTADLYGRDHLPGAPKGKGLKEGKEKKEGKEQKKG